MSQLNAQGGIEPVMKMLLDQGLLHGDCLTVTGKTVKENLQNINGYTKEQSIVMGLDKPIKNTSHLRILYGNLSPEGAVAKITGKEGTSFSGIAKR